MSRFLFLFLIACAPHVDLVDRDISQDEPLPRGESIVGEFELLEFLNSPETDLDVLDLDVGLDRRAARSLINYRDGADGVFPSEDDELYSNVAEVDRIERVGPATLEALVDYALWWAAPEAFTDTVVEGVAFTSREAEHTVSLVNLASVDELDVDIDLDIRAVDAIIDARPIHSVHDLATVYYVGPSALRALRDYAGEAGPTHPEFGPDLGE